MVGYAALDGVKYQTSESMSLFFAPFLLSCDLKLLILVEVLAMSLTLKCPTSKQCNALILHVDHRSSAASYLDQFGAFPTWSMGYLRREMYRVDRLTFCQRGAEGKDGRIMFTFSNTRSSVLPFHSFAELAMAANREACSSVQLNQI